MHRTGTRRTDLNRILVAVGLALACAAVVATSAFVTRAARGLHVADHEGPGAPSDRHLALRPRALSPTDSGVLLDPFSAGRASSSPQGWILLDLSSRELMVVTREGGVARRLGRHGQGPGELEYPGLAARADDGTVVVVDAFTRHIDIFPYGGEPWRWSVDAGDCDVGDPVALWPRPDGGLLLLRTCTSGLSRSLELVRLAVGEPQVSTSLGRLPGVVQDMFHQPLAVALRGRILVGSTRRTCFSEVDSAGTGLTDRRVCLPAPHPIETPDSILQARLGRSLGRLARTGLKVTLPDRMPALADLRETSRGAALQVVLGDLSEAWAFEEDGELVYAELAEGVRAYPGWEAWLLLADELEGLRIWTVPYSRWTDPD